MRVGTIPRWTHSSCRFRWSDRAIRGSLAVCSVSVVVELGNLRQEHRQRKEQKEWKARHALTVAHQDRLGQEPSALTQRANLKLTRTNSLPCSSFLRGEPLLEKELENSAGDRSAAACGRGCVCKHEAEPARDCDGAERIG